MKIQNCEERKKRRKDKLQEMLRIEYNESIKRNYVLEINIVGMKKKNT